MVGFNYIVYAASVFVWLKCVDAEWPGHSQRTSRGMTVGGHLYMSVVRLDDILSYSDTGPHWYSPVVMSGASLDKVDTWTGRLVL